MKMFKVIRCENLDKKNAIFVSGLRAFISFNKQIFLVIFSINTVFSVTDIWDLLTNEIKRLENPRGFKNLMKIYFL